MQQRNKYQMKEQGKTPEELIEMEIGTTLETRNQLLKKKYYQNTNTWRLNKMQLKTQWLTEEVKEETKKSEDK